MTSAIKCCYISLFSSHTGLQPYLLFADGDFGIIYRSNLNSSDIQRLVTGLHSPIALDYDYRYSHCNILIIGFMSSKQLCRA